MDKVLEQVLRGRADANILFRDLRNLLLRLGFEERTNGDHHTFRRAGVRELINLQKEGTRAKSYQVRQVGLWRGAGSAADRSLLEKMEADMPSLPVDRSTWDTACRLANFKRTRGLQFPTIDLLIFACAKQHNAELVSRDKHFEQLAEIWPRV